MPAPDTTTGVEVHAPTRRATPAWVWTALKAAFTTTLLVLVFVRVDVSAVLGAFASTRPIPLLLAFLWVAAAIVISAYKWGRILARRGVRAGMRDLTRLYYIASFFNAVLPTSVGGDPIRAWMLGKEKRAMSESFASVVSERLIASAALGVSSAIGLLFVPRTPVLVGLVALFLLVDAALVGLFLVPRFASSIVRAVIPPKYDHVTEATEEALVAVRQTLLDWPLVIEVFVLSVVFQGFVAMVNFSLFAAFGSPVTAGMALLYSPMVSTLAMLPVSLSGLGVPQVAYAYFFGLSGAPEAVSVAVSFGFFVVVAVSTLPGAILFMFARSSGETDGI